MESHILSVWKAEIFLTTRRCEYFIIKGWEKGVTLAQLVKASVGQTDVQRFEPHLRHK